MRLIFMDEALNDLEYIHDFLITAGVLQAAEIKDKIIASATRLVVFPRSGTKVYVSPQWGEIRDIFPDNYCLRYAYYQGDVYILRIWHQKENQRNE